MCSEQEKYDLIVRNLQEVIGGDDLRNLLKRPEPVAVYWGTATTGKPHVAYFVPIIKLADMLQAGMKVIVLFADLHAYLDNMKAPWSLLRYRTRYYEAVIKGMFKSVNVPLTRLHFIRGADYELTEAYSTDVYRLLTVASVHDAHKAGAEVVKQVSNPLVSGLLYPLLQALDEVHLGVDVQFGGVDQRKIFMLAEKYLPHLGHKKRIHLMNPMVPGLTGAKMSASEVDSKIDLLDSAELVTSKMAGAICAPNASADQGNGVLAFLKYVVFPLATLQMGVHVPGQTKPYTNYADLERDYLAGIVTAEALKRIVVDCLNGRLDQIRADFDDPNLSALVEKAYPPTETTVNATPVAHVRHMSGGWLSLLWDNWFMRTLFHSLASYWRPLNTAQMTDLSLDVPELTVNNASDIPRRLAEFDAHLMPIQATDALLTVLEEEFPDSSVELSSLLHTNNRLRCVWSITPMGLPHLGHTIPLRKLARMSQFDGVHIIVLVNDIAAYLRGTVSWDVMRPRGEFCRLVVTALFKALGGRATQLTCLLGSEFQLAGDYMLQFYRLVSMVPEADCFAASDVSDCLIDTADVDESSVTHPTGVRVTMGQLLLPCTDFVDTLYLGAHVRLAHTERARKRRVFERHFIGAFTSSQTHTAHLSHCMLPSLQVDTATTDGSPQTILRPMRSCLPSSRWHGPSAAQALAAQAEDAVIPIVEPPPVGVTEGSVMMGLKRRLKRAFCQPGNVTVNPLLDLYRYVLLPEAPADGFTISRSEKNGGPLYITGAPEGLRTLEAHWKSLQSSFASEALHPGDLKPAIEMALSCARPESFASRISASLPSWSELMPYMDAAFPPPPRSASGKARPVKTKTSPQATGDDRPTTNGASLNNGIVPCVDTLDPNRLDIRIGRIVSVSRHPNADTLYIEQVDFGAQMGQRTVVSGLVGLYPMDMLHGRTAVFVTNLKPIRMRGVESQAMLLCASHRPSDPESAQLIRPLEVPDTLTSSLGTRLVFHSPENATVPVCQPDPVVSPKTKLWERLSSELKLTSHDRGVCWRSTWRLGDESATHWVTGSSELPIGATVC